MGTKANRLFIEELKSIGFVDAGANEGADIIIAKRAGDSGDCERHVVEIVKAAETGDRRRVTAWAYKFKNPDGSLVRDSGGTTRVNGVVVPTECDDIVDSPEAMKAFENAFYDFVSSGKAGADDMHVEFDVARIAGGLFFSAEKIAALNATGVLPVAALVDVEIPRTDRGDQLWADIIAGKRKQMSIVARVRREPIEIEAEATDAASLDALSTVLDALDLSALKVGAKVSGPRLAKLKAALSALQEIMTEVEGGPMSKETEKAEPTIESLQAENAALTAKLAAVTAEPEDVMKGASPEVLKRFEDLEKRTAAAEETAKAERNTRETGEMVAKVKADMPNIVGKPEDLGATLKRIKDVATAEDFTVIETVLKAASNALTALGGISTAKGEDGGDSATASQQIESAAMELLKSERLPSLAAARVEVRKRNPALAKAEREEQAAPRH